MQRSPLQELSIQNGRILGLNIKQNALVGLESMQPKPVEFSSGQEPASAASQTAGMDASKTSAAPKTPLKASGRTGTPPLTPLANLKVLIAAASSAMENETSQHDEASCHSNVTVEVKCGEAKVAKETEEGGGRKMRSLAILCKKFLAIAESEIGVGTDFSLESMSKKLGTNRRRIYDIINVLEALEMIVKQSKNWYTWLGQDGLLVTLAKMRAMAEDDVDFRNLLHKENSNGHQPTKENQPPPLAMPTATAAAPGERVEPVCKQEEEPFCPSLGDEGSSAGGGAGGGGGRWDKSLGVLCQKFIMLFLVTPDHEVTLDFAGNILMPDEGGFSPQPTNPKTKVRRLYDIANVLTTLGLIRKKTFLAPNHRKMPGYSWAGPSLDQIQEISVFRKSEFNLYPFYSKKKGAGGGVALTRKPSFGSMRPFLHQYEVKGHAMTMPCAPNSAPSSPVKTKESGFKRSLSFGAGVRTKSPSVLPPPRTSLTEPPPHVADVKNRSAVTTCATPTSQVGQSSTSKCVLARQLSSGQVNYLQEVREFESEIQKHAHKYPHVAPVFAEFVNKLQVTLEKAADHTPKFEASPTPLSSPTFTVSPHELPSTMFLSPQSLGGCGVSSNAPLLPGATMMPGRAATPIMTHGTLSPRPTKYSQFTCVENALIGTNHTHNVNSVQHIISRSLPSGIPTPFTMENSPFNPNSLLVNAANGYSIYPTPNFFPVSAPSPVVPTTRLGGPSLSLMTPKPIVVTSTGHSTLQDTSDISSPPKRACLNVAEPTN